MAFTDNIFTIPSIPMTPELAQVVGTSANQVVALFPVRLETRYFQTPPQGFELRVRVYPDKVHVDTHEPELTEQELIWGKHFWEQTWRAAKVDELKKLAWRQLAERFGSNRAAWVARSLTPLNPVGDWPLQPIGQDLPLPKPISFPAPATKAESWTRAPHSLALPKKWWVLGYKNGMLAAQAVGNLIPDKLPTGPNPAAPSATIPDTELAIDDGIKWMVNFEEAERLGMGVRLRLTTDQALMGFDILLVLGVKSDLTPTASADELKRLLDAHHYTDGISFVLPGTPTNNTVDAPSGFSSTDPGEEQSYLAERAAPALVPGDGSNADVLAKALGLQNGNATAVSNFRNGRVREQVDARHMNRALWPATWGYFLSQMMSGSPISFDDAEWARQHFVENVRASGPLPTIRIGKQPYGILPVTSLNLWKPRTANAHLFTRDVKLQWFLTTMRGVWRQNLSEVPRIGRGGNPAQDFTDILSMDGVSSSYSIRHLMGDRYLRSLWSLMFPGGDHPQWWRKQRAMAKVGLSTAGLTGWTPFLSTSTYSGFSQTLAGPLVQPEMLSEDARLSPDYIGLLLAESDPQKLRRETFTGVQPKGLLYSLLRHSLLLEYWAAASNLSSEKALQFGIMGRPLEEEMIGLGGNLPQLWDLLTMNIPWITQEGMWSLLFNLFDTVPDNPEVIRRVTPLLELRESMLHLQGLSARSLERLSAGTLDLCSHRLDAWITSFATKRLAEVRLTNPTGILLGGYGWVTNLKPAPAAGFETLPPGEQGPLLKLPNNPGYTHTPSLGQAATVAVLRSGHLTHSNSTTGDLLALDLSSDRVSLAKWLLDGVRQGQPLGALLGYRFERRLQQAGLGEFIPFFRDLAPLVARKLEPSSGQPVESIAANNVVDGLLLQRKWNEIPRAVLFGANFLQILFNPLIRKPDPQRLQLHRTLLEAELNLLDDSVDAVSDALIAESVHHAVQGNPLRTAATLDAVATGDAPPPELEVVRTPRTGSALTHRVIALFGGAAPLAVEWRTPTVPHRSQAEPYLNSWASRLLGLPSKVRCQVERLDPTTAQVAETKELLLSEIGLSPLDFIYAAEGNRDAQPSEIEHRILYAIKRKTDGFAKDALIRINPGRGAGWAATDVSYGEFVELLRTAKRLITTSRAIDGSELDLPELNRPPAIDMTELQRRADTAETAIKAAVTDLQARITAAGSGSLDALRPAILRAAHFGITGAVPNSPIGDTPEDREVLSFQGASVLIDLKQRVDQITALKAGFVAATATEIEKRDYHIARLRLVFGETFVVLPRFTAANADDLGKALADSAKIQDNDPLAVVTWFERVSRVREGVARLNASLGYSDALQTGERFNFKIAQLPYRPDDRWVGLPMKPGQALSPSRFSMVIQAMMPFDVKQPLAGLLIDEWVEVVPSSVETTGLVFQYDQPDSAPPQAILLAVPPDPDAQWNIWLLQQVLLETLDLARIRAVDPDSLEEFGHYLPALYFAANAADDNVSTDFSNLK